MDVLLLLARLVLSATFAVAGVSKLADRSGSRQGMVDFGVPAFFARPLGLLVPIGELVLAIALIPLVSAWWGAIGVSVLLLLFILGISINLARGRKPDCHCFGQLHSSPIGWKTLARNAVLTGMAGLLVWQGPQMQGASLMSVLSVFRSGSTTVMTLLAGLAVFQLWAIFHLLRQNGRLLLRLEAIEAKLGKAETAAPGLPVNSAAPNFQLSRLDGGTVTLELLQQAGKAVLLIFTEPECGACDALLPYIGRWQREQLDRLVIALVSRGKLEANRAKAATHHLRNVLLQRDRETAEAYQVGGTPSAVLVRDGKIGSPLAEGADTIRDLVAQATLPPPVQKGERAPVLRLPDLDGESIDLATLCGGNTLLLFWSPSCGFCQTMLDDIRVWERYAPQDGTKMVVISSGTVEANRAQGFRSPVLLDQEFLAGRLFGVGGTPSAVMLDEQGRVASEVTVGAPAVLALADGLPAGSGRP